MLLRWIPVLPLVAAGLLGVLIGVVRRSPPRWAVAGLSSGAVGASGLLSLLALMRLTDETGQDRVLVDSVYTWIGVGIRDTRLAADLAFRMDALAAAMVLLVCGLGLLAHLAAAGLVASDGREDRGYPRFFCLASLATGGMLTLVLAENLAVALLGWQLVGLASFLMIGFWFSDPGAARAGSRAFVVTSLTDFGAIAGTLILFGAFAQGGLDTTLSLHEIAVGLPALAQQGLPAPALTWLWGDTWPLYEILSLCFLLSIAGRCGQIPFHSWLPDSASAPAPGAALIHAVTTIPAAVYLLSRLGFLFASAPLASSVMVWLGAASALFGACLCLTQTDLGKVLASSTLSQLGLVLVAAGGMAFSTSVYHLVTHGFIKGLLFLAAGAVFVALQGERDLRRMGGLRRRLPGVHIVFFIGIWALAGLPPFAGFFSLGEIYSQSYGASVPGRGLLFAAVVLIAFLTSLYAWRAYFLAFGGELRAAPAAWDRVRDPRRLVLWPLFGLAALAAGGGVFGIPQVYGNWMGVDGSHSLANFLAPVLPPNHHSLPNQTELTLAVLSTLVAAAGFGVARLLYARDLRASERLRTHVPSLHRALQEKLYTDLVYDRVLVRPLYVLCRRVLARGLEERLLERLLMQGTAGTLRGFVDRVLKPLQPGLAAAYAIVVLLGALAVIGYLLARGNAWTT